MSHHDAIVIGAGPAGSTTAALLAEKGHDVLVIEKETFPRYHVGESLMPFCWFTLDRLGLTQEMDERAFVKKHSVQFVNQDGKQSRPFYFFQHYDHPSATTWQVERAEFDDMIFRKAQANGAKTLEGTEVKEIIRDESGAMIGVKALHPDGSLQEHFGKVTIDCSGRDGFITRKEKLRNRDPELKKIAIWTYYKGAMRDEGIDEGNTTVAYIPNRGWFWYIPLKNDMVSVGVVADRDYLYRDDERGLEQIFSREIQQNAWIEKHLECGEQTGEFWVTGEYSYRSKYCAGNGYVLAGDAFAFLDPVFSSGVFLALKTGELAADAVDLAIKNEDYSAGQFQAYGQATCDAMERMRALVYAFYDEGFSFGKLIKANPELRPSLTDCLIGDLYDDKFAPLFAAVREIAEVPSLLDYGMHVEESSQVTA